MEDKRFLRMFASLHVGLWQYESSSDSFSCDETFLEVFSYAEQLESFQRLIIESIPRKSFRVEFNMSTFECTVEEENGVFFGTLKDITNELEEKKELHNLAYYDSLTGLQNRASCIDHLSNTENKKGFYLYLDIQKFKSINDTFGHAFGDKVLIGFADILKAATNNNGHVFRLSGDEFFIHIELTKFPMVRRIINKIILDLKNMPLTGVVDLRCNIGIVKYKQTETVASILQKADLAMYIAKHSKNLDFVLADNNVMDKFIDEVEYNIRMNKIMNFGLNDVDSLVVRRTTDNSMIHSLVSSIYKNN